MNLDNIKYPDWCKWLQEKGELSDTEMKKIFNCGIGYIVFIRPYLNNSNLNIKELLYIGRVIKI